MRSRSHFATATVMSAVLAAQLYQQAFVFDPRLNAFGGALSDAAELQVGN